MLRTKHGRHFWFAAVFHIEFFRYHSVGSDENTILNTSASYIPSNLDLRTRRKVLEVKRVLSNSCASSRYIQIVDALLWPTLTCHHFHRPLPAHGPAGGERGIGKRICIDVTLPDRGTGSECIFGKFSTTSSFFPPFSERQHTDRSTARVTSTERFHPSPGLHQVRLPWGAEIEILTGKTHQALSYQVPKHK